jgi:hypothetical protein
LIANDCGWEGDESRAEEILLLSALTAIMK